MASRDTAERIMAILYALEQADSGQTIVKQDDGTFAPANPSTSPVSSVFGRVGDIDLELGDILTAVLPTAVNTGQGRTVTTTDIEPDTGVITLAQSDHAVWADQTNGPLPLALFEAADYHGRLEIKAIGNSLNLVTLEAFDGDLIYMDPTNYATSWQIGLPGSGALFACISLMSDGTNWQII